MEHRDKLVQIYPSTYKIHTAYKSLISSPPKGYKFVGGSSNYKLDIVEFLRKYTFVKNSYHFFIKLFKSSLFFDFFHGKSKEMEQVDLIYSTGIIYHGKKPWILDILDHPACITGYKNDILRKNKAEIEKVLLAENCRKIICSHKTSFDIMKSVFSKEVLKKTLVLTTPIIPGSIKKSIHKKDKVQILFVGSINNPRDFYVKGGLEAVKSFELLSKRCTDARLTIRCRLPSEIKGMIKKIKGITVIENEISKEELEMIYSDSDIFLLPGHHFHLMAMLEAMSFGLPIIVLDTYAFKDYVRQGYNGFKIKKSDKIPSYFEKDYPNNLRKEKFIAELKYVDTKVIERIAKKLEWLIKNPRLRKNMGNNGLKLVKTKFSIQERNNKLKKILDMALEFKKL